MKSVYKLSFLVLITMLVVTTSFSQSVSFTSSGLSGAAIDNPTSLQFGPDNRLYVSQQDGTIYAFTIQRNGPNNYAVTATETILLVKNIVNHNDNGVVNNSITSRQVTGLLVKGTPTNPILYVSSSDPREGGGGSAGDKGLDTNSGIVSKLTWNGSTWVKVDVVIGLPRSEENHAVNGMQLDEATNILYLVVGGHTNAGAPSNNFAFLTEYALSAAVLSIDLTMIQNSFGGSYTLPTLDDPTRANSGPNGSDLNDPFGGNDGLNQAKLVAGGPVQIHSPGYRNAYDIVITKTPGKEGRMYTIDNGANGGWGGHPAQEGAFGNPLTTSVTNNYVVGEPGSTGPGPNDDKVNNDDNLHLVSKPGMTPIYGGHPNPIRANPSGAGLYWYDNATSTANFQLNPTVDWPPVPLAMANPVEGDFRNPGVNDGALYVWTQSTNGITEYTSNKFFGGAMVGDLIAACFDGSLYRIKLVEDGTAVDFVQPLASGFGSIPLDVTAQGVGEVFEGSVWAVTYGADNITVFEPQGYWENVTAVDASSPIGRHENSFVEANDKFYLIGGRETTTTNVYDPSLKVWTAAAQLPFRMHHFQAVEWQGKIYVMGAYQGSFSTGNVNNSESPVNNIYIYDPITDIWTEGPVIPRPRGSAGVVVFNNEFYLISGIVNGHHDGWVNWVDKYNPTTQQWTILADAPQERDHFQAVEIGGKIYLAGGRKSNAMGNIFAPTIPEVDVYDIASNTWQTLPISSNLLTQRAGTSSIVLNDELYLIGGESISKTTSHKECEIFNPTTQTWRIGPPLITGRHGTGAINYNNAVFTAAGSANRGGGPVLTTMELLISLSTCTGDINNFSLDDDEDGYSNGDETLNGTNPCSAASIPNDFDGDFLSDLSDSDDDNDGINDSMDLFALDASNGLNTNIPLSYPFFNGDPGFGLFGMGFTGLMSNQTDDYMDLYDSEHPDLIMGGAAGIATVPANSGDAKTNDQGYAFQFGFRINPANSGFTVKSKLQGTPFFNGIALGQLQDQTQGVYIGTGDQDNYLKVVLDANFGNPGITIFGENGGVQFIDDFYAVTDILTTGILYLYFDVDIPNSEVTVYYQTGSDVSRIVLGTPIALPSSFTNLLNGSAAMATGLIASSGIGPEFSASWDFTSITTGKPFVNEDAPSFFNKFVGNPTPSFVLDLNTVFDDDGGVGNLTYEIVSVANNTFIDNYSLTNGILTINFISDELGSAKVVVKATDGDGLTEEYDFLMQVIPEPNPFLRLNTGSLFSYGSWAKDTYFTGGSRDENVIPISNTTDDVLFQTNRYSTDMTYEIPVPKIGYYRVNLLFAEIFHGVENTKGIGARIFDVEAEGNTRLSNYDVYQKAGGPAIAFIEAVDSVFVDDGFLSLQFIASVDNAIINAIELSEYTLDPIENTAPIVDNPGDRQVFEGQDFDLQIVASDFNFGDILQYTATGLPTSLSIDQNTGLISGTIEASENDFPVVVTVNDGQGGVSQVNFTIQVMTPANYSLRINAGGSQQIYGSEVWEEDQFYLRGSTNSTTAAIGNTLKDEIYQTERFGNSLDYEIPMPGAGKFLVVLHFAEINWTAAGQRLFNLDIESGQGSLNNYDIFQKAGGANIATTETFAVDVTDGALTLEFTRIVDQSKISAIELSYCIDPIITSFTPSATEICKGNSLTLTVNGSLGSATSWNLYTASCGGTLVESNNTGIFIVSPTINTTYYVRPEGVCVDDLSCVSVDIQVDEPQDATITTPGVLCVNDAAITLVAATGGGTWSGPGITDGSAGTFNPSTAGPGSHLITYTLTVGTCTSVDTETIQVDPAPNATITVAGPFCVSDGGVALTAATTGGTWTGVGITDGSAGTFTPASAGVGNHVITYTLTVGACTSIDTETIQVNAIPNATITAAGPFCANGTPVNLTAATTGGTWSGTGITDASLGTFNPSTAGAGSHVITYILSVGACTSIDTETITVNPIPNATITAAGPFCTSDAALNLSAATAGGVWSGTGITNSSAGTFNPATAGPGNHLITYTLVVGPCTVIDTETIQVLPIPDATIAPAGPFCANDAALNLTAATTGGVWSGTGITNGSAGTFNPSVAGQGSHVITYTIIIGGCTSIDTETIQVNPIPNATITAAGPFCESDVALNLVAVTGGGTWSGVGITNASTGTFDPSVSGPGNHVITYTITAGGCTSVDTETIQVLQFVDPIIAAAGPLCDNNSPINLSLTAGSGGGTWSGNGITNASAGTFDPSASGPGNHLVTYSVTVGACSSFDTETIQVVAAPDATIALAGPLCETASPVTLTAATVGGTWSGAGITNGSAGTFDPAVAGQGSHVVTYSVTVGACTSIDTETIVVTTVNTQITISGNTLTASATGATYQWINCNGNIDIAGQTGKSFTPEESGSYAVRVTVNGCTSTSSCVDVVIVGLQEHLSELILVYPNPASSRVTIELPVPSTNIMVNITDATGRSAISNFYDYGNKIELDTQELSPGMYILHLKASQMAKTIKLVIR